MLRGDQRTDEVKGCLGQGVERFGAVVAFVEDQRDVITGLDQMPVVGGQVFGDGTELDAVVDVAGIDAVKQWDVKIGAHQQAQIDLPQVASLLFVMAALGQLGRGAGVDVGEEVGAVVNQGTEIELKSLDEPFGHLSLELQDLVGGDEVHVVPEVLGGEQRGIYWQQVGEDGAAVPVGQVHLTGRRDGAVEGGDQSAKCTLLVGAMARLKAASRRYWPQGRPWWRLGNRESSKGTRSRRWAISHKAAISPQEATWVSRGCGGICVCPVEATRSSILPR